MFYFHLSDKYKCQDFTRWLDLIKAEGSNPREAFLLSKMTSLCLSFKSNLNSSSSSSTTPTKATSQDDFHLTLLMMLLTVE